MPARNIRLELLYAMPDADTSERSQLVDALWSADAVRDAAELGCYWLANLAVRERVNRLASDRADGDAYDRLADLARRNRWPLPFPRALSLGCGFGGLERDLVRRGIVGEIVGIDLAAGAVEEARRLAAADGLSDRITYRVADLEQAHLPPGWADIVFAHQAVHHIKALDDLFAAARRALRPGGLLHLHEFVGPNRFQWTDAQLRLANEFLDSLPPRLRATGPDGAPKPRMRRPTVAEMIAADPTEAVRATEIMGELRLQFRVVDQRPLGGAVVHLALAEIARNFDPADSEAAAALEHLFAMEDRAMVEGAVGSDFLAVTAVRRSVVLPAILRRALAPKPSPVPPQPDPDAFDERWYLDVNPDVSAAVEAGHIASGRTHWETFGRAEGRPGAP